MTETNGKKIKKENKEMCQKILGSSPRMTEYGASGKDRNTSSETGRSMVEMLGVLAVVGVLSIGGVAGYRYAVDKMNANEIINELKKRAITASQQRILGQGINLAEYGVGAKIKGTYTVTPTDTYNGNASQFALEVAGVPERVCDMIIDSDWALPTAMAVNGGSCVEGDNGNTMTFAFNNTLESGDAGNGETTEDLGQKNCSGKGTWNGSYCECNDGFGGEDCAETRDPNECDGHGKVWNPLPDASNCLCDRGWSGNGIWSCDQKEDVCNGHGIWNGCGCNCDRGWSGYYFNGSFPEFCLKNIDACNGHGYFQSYSGSYFYRGCICDDGWSGDDCSLEGIATETISNPEVTETATETVTKTDTVGVGGQICDTYGECHDCSSSKNYIPVDNSSECAKCDGSGYQWVYGYVGADSYKFSVCHKCSPSGFSDLEDNVDSSCGKCGLGVDWDSCRGGEGAYRWCSCASG